MENTIKRVVLSLQGGLLMVRTERVIRKHKECMPITDENPSLIFCSKVLGRDIHSTDDLCNQDYGKITAELLKRNNDKK